MHTTLDHDIGTHQAQLIRHPITYAGTDISRRREGHTEGPECS
jgi:hypothetical protein